MKDFFNQAIADGLNELGYGVDAPNEKGEMKFGPECHEVCTISEKLNKMIESGELKYESSKQSGEDTGENKEIKNRMPRMVRIETWEW